MKKALYIFICICVIIGILFGALAVHGSKAVNEVGDNMYASFLGNCDKGTVVLKKSFFGVRVTGKNCNGPDSGGQGYGSTLFAHFFWLDR